MNKCQNINCTSPIMANEDFCPAHLSSGFAIDDLKYDTESNRKYGLELVESAIKSELTEGKQSPKAVATTEYTQRTWNGYEGINGGMKQMNSNIDRKPNTNIAKSVGRSSGKKP